MTTHRTGAGTLDAILSTLGISTSVLAGAISAQLTTAMPAITYDEAVVRAEQGLPAAEQDLHGLRHLEADACEEQVPPEQVYQDVALSGSLGFPSPARPHQADRRDGHDLPEEKEEERL